MLFPCGTRQQILAGKLKLSRGDRSESETQIAFTPGFQFGEAAPKGREVAKKYRLKSCQVSECDQESVEEPLLLPYKNVSIS